MGDDVAGKLFVGGVSWQTSDDGLRYYFEKYGKLIDVATMKDKFSGQPRGFGFVQFEDPSVIDKVLAEQHTLDGRTLDIKKAISRVDAPRGSASAGPSSSSRLESKKIFVGGLDLSVTEEDFKEYFSKFGEITDAVVMVDKETGRSRGFGFISYSSDQAVRDVIRDNHEIKGKFVEVKQAEPRESRQQGGRSGGGRSDRGRGGGRGRGGFSSGRGGGSYGQDYGSYGSYGGGGGGGGGGYGASYGGGGYGSAGGATGGSYGATPAAYSSAAYGAATPTGYAVPYTAYSAGAGAAPAYASMGYGASGAVGAYGGYSSAAGYGTSSGYGSSAGYGSTVDPSASFNSTYSAAPQMSMQNSRMDRRYGPY